MNRTNKTFIQRIHQGAFLALSVLSLLGIIVDDALACTSWREGSCRGPLNSDDTISYVTGACSWTSTSPTCISRVNYNICKTESYGGGSPMGGCYTDIRNYEGCGICSGSLLAYDNQGGMSCGSVTFDAGASAENKAAKCGEYFECYGPGENCFQCMFDAKSGKCNSSIITEDCNMGGEKGNHYRTTQNPCRNPCYEASGDGSMTCGVGLDKTCGVCMRVSPKEGIVCCGQINAPTGQVMNIRPVEASSCPENFENIDYNKYCYSGACTTNSDPYIDKYISPEEGKRGRPIKILGNPELLKVADPASEKKWKEGGPFPLTYYKNVPGWSGFESKGIKPPFVDGGKLEPDSYEFSHRYPDPERSGKCGSNLPADEVTMCRVETSPSSLACEPMKDRGYNNEFHRNEDVGSGSCSGGLAFTSDLFTQVDLNTIPVADIIACEGWDTNDNCIKGKRGPEDALTLGYSLDFKAWDDAKVEGKCGRPQDKLSVSLTSGVTMCPGGTRDLDEMVFDANYSTKFPELLHTTVNVKASDLTMTIDPNDDLCGFVSSRTSLNTMMSWAVWKEIKAKIDTASSGGGLNIKSLLSVVNIPSDLDCRITTPDGEIRVNNFDEAVQEIYDYHFEAQVTGKANLNVKGNAVEGSLKLNYTHVEKEWHLLPLPGWKILKKERRTATCTYSGKITKGDSIRGPSLTAQGIKLLRAQMKENKPLLGVDYVEKKADWHWFKKAPEKFSDACCPHNKFMDLFSTIKSDGVIKKEGANGLVLNQTTSTAATTFVVQNNSGVQSNSYYFGPAGSEQPGFFAQDVSMEMDYNASLLSNNSGPALYDVLQDYIENAGIQYADQEMVSCVLSPAGGTCSSLDGKFRLTIPPGAVSKEIEYKIARRVVSTPNWVPTYPACYQDSYSRVMNYATRRCSPDQREILADVDVTVCNHPGTINAYISHIKTEGIADTCADNQLCVAQQSYPGMTSAYCAPVTSCTGDSDGTDFNTYGYVETNQGSFTDTCLNSKEVLEYKCINGGLQTEKHLCPRVCRDNRCQNYLADTDNNGVITMQEILEFEARNRLAEKHPQYVDGYTLYKAMEEWQSQDEIE